VAIADDWSIDASNNIRYEGTTVNYHVITWYQWLQSLSDDQQAVGDDLMDITFQNPAQRTLNIINLLNGYNIDDTAAEHLYGGSITQDNGDTVYSGLQVVGGVNSTATQIKIIQDNKEYQYTTTPGSPYWGDQSSPYNGGGQVLLRVLIKTRVNGCNIDGQQVRVQARHYSGTDGDTYAEFGTQLGVGEVGAAINTTDDPQNSTSQATVTAYIDVLNSGGTANAPTGGYQTIDLGEGSGAQPYYSQWTYGSQPDERKAIWEYTKDLIRTGTTKTVDNINGELFRGITHEIDYDGQSVNFQEREEVVWGTTITYNTLVSGPFTPGNYVTIGANGAAGRVMDDDGVSTLVVALEDTSITLLNGDVITEYPGPGAGVTSTTAAINVTIADNDKKGGSGLILAMNDAGTTGTLWIQLLTGVAPVDNLPLIGSTSNGDGLVQGAPTVRPIPAAFTGSYVGNYIGAFGVGFDPNDLTANDSVTDLLGVTRNPPNNVTFSVTGLVSGEDRVLVGPRSAGALDRAQLTLNADLTGAAETSVVVLEAIPSDTPLSGTIRVQLNTGIYRYQTYTSWTGSTFTIPSTDYSGSNQATGAKEVFISYIDKLAASDTETFTTIFNTTRNLTVYARDGSATPIKPFEAQTAQLISTGGTQAVTRTSDA